MAESTYQQAGEQHINLLRQSNSPQPVLTAHQRQQQQAISELALDSQQLNLDHQPQAALVAVQDLERQRVQMSSPALAAKQPR